MVRSHARVLWICLLEGLSACAPSLPLPGGEAGQAADVLGESAAGGAGPNPGAAHGDAGANGEREPYSAGGAGAPGAGIRAAAGVASTTDEPAHSTGGSAGAA